MLKPAILYADQVKQKMYGIWHNEKYKFYNYYSYWAGYNPKEDTWSANEFVSVNDNDEVIGFIQYEINRSTNSANALGIINFTDDISLTFGKDVLQVLKDIFEKYKFHKLSFSVVIGNPIEKTYDKFINKFGGRIVGIAKEHTKLVDGLYYDVKQYEILNSEYQKKKYII